MSENATQSSRPPVSLKGLQERVLLSAALMRFNAQLRNFTPLRDRLAASGQDANAAYRQIESRRDQLMAELKKLTPAPVPRSKSFRPPRPGAVLSPPIAPASFLPPRNSPWFGYSGSVSVGVPLREGDDIIPPGTTKGILTSLIDDLGRVSFRAPIDADPLDGHPKEYFWLHSWISLIPFPAPVVDSTFTYSFPVFVEVQAENVSGAVTFWSFVSVGETPDFVGQEVIVNTVDSWPLVTDLGAYVPDYQGQSNVQRSVVVKGGHVPAVAVALGVVLALESGAGVYICYGSISLGHSHAPMWGVANTVNFRYDPIPPPIKTA